MRKSILLPLLLAGCTGDGPGDTYTEVPDFRAIAAPVTCEALDLGPVAVEQIRGATDTSFLVLDAAQHRLTEFGDDLRPLWSLEYDEHGPAGIDRPVSAALIGDTAVAVAARGGLRLVVLDRGGELLQVHGLEFMPQAVAAVGDEIFVTAVPLGTTPGTLLFRLRDGVLDPIPVPPRPYDDMIVGGLGNQALVEALDDGNMVVVHQFLAPRAFHVSGDGTVESLQVPIPDATAGSVDFVPRPPLSREHYPRMLVPALDMAVDRPRREVYLLTRSGRDRDGRMERAVIRTDDRLDFLAAFTLDVHAVQLAILPRRGAAVVADDLDRLYLCPLHADTRAE